jgi:hypothetical protein
MIQKMSECNHKWEYAKYGNICMECGKIEYKLENGRDKDGN